MNTFTFVCFMVLIIIVKSVYSELDSVKGKEVILSKNTTTEATGVIAIETTSTTQRPLLQGSRLPCSCLEGQCGCCTGVILERFRQKVCMNITYDPDDFAFTAAMSLNERVLYKNTLSGKNPPPVCIRLPRLRFIQLCFTFSNIYFASRNMHVCTSMEANWEDLTLLEFSFDCVRLGANGFAVIPPEEGGGVPGSPIDQEEQTDEDYDDSARDVPIPVRKIAQPENSERKDNTNILRKPERRHIEAKLINNNVVFYLHN